MEFWFFFIVIFISLILEYCPWRPITFIVALLTTAYFGGVATFSLLEIRTGDREWADIWSVIFGLGFAWYSLQRLVRCSKGKKPVNEELEEQSKEKKDI